MSFSKKVKKEALNQKKLKKIEKVSELCGIIRFGGTISLYGNDKLSLAISTENPAVARRVFSLYKNVFDKKLEIYFEKKTERSKKGVFTLFAPENEDCKNKLIELGMIEENGEKIEAVYDIPEFIEKDIENKKSYIRGGYIVSGSISDPEKSYHVEWTTKNIENAESFAILLQSFNIKSNISKKKNGYICYIKEADSISNLLNILGAHQSMFKFEDIRIKKQMRNDVNRIVNCETSNLERVVKTAFRQIESINYIIEKNKFDSLDESLKEIALIRLNNPDMSLREIGEFLERPLTKSGVNHRLIKIEKIAENLKEEKNAN